MVTGQDVLSAQTIIVEIIRKKILPSAMGEDKAAI
jgi:hypothetical protein